MATAATPTSTAEAPARTFVARFGRTERALHWIHALGFTAMLASGLVLYLPWLSGLAARPTVKAVHLGVVTGWATALVLVWALGDRRALRRTRHELETYLPEDLVWLRGRSAPQGRFNAGQKSHAVVQAALAALFVLSGALLWLGERAAPLRLPGTVALHDGAMFVALALVAGHVFLSVVWPATRPAMRGMVQGTVRADWAARHHALWRPSVGRAAPPPGARRLLLAGGVLLAGALACVLLVRSSLVPEGPTAAPAPAAAAPPLRPGADTLAIEASEAMQAGDPGQAVGLLRQASKQEPDRLALRVSLGEAQASAGDVAGAERTLRAAAARQLLRRAP